MARDSELHETKVPDVTLGFWIIKILATTLGETGGDTVTMTLDWGYLAGTAIFLAVLIALVIAQIAARKFQPFLYWATIVASTTFGTTMADFATRSLGIGYTGGSLLLLTCLVIVLALWYWSEGTISVNTVSTPRVEAFYWAAITFSQTLGTALGDWIADNRYALMALGAGIAGAPSWAEGIGRGLQLAVAGAQADRQRQMLSAQQAATAQALRERRVPNAELIAAMHPQLARILLTRPGHPGAARDNAREAARLTR